MDIVIFEDEKVYGFYPLTLLRPVFDLRCGMFTMKDRIIRKYPRSKVYFIARDCVSDMLKTHGAISFTDTIPMPDTALFINGRLLLKHSEGIKCDVDESLWVGDEVAAFCLSRANITRFLSSMKSSIIDPLRTNIRELTKCREADLRLVSYGWELVAHNAEMLAEDFPASGVKGKWDSGAVLYGPKSKLFVDSDSSIEAGVIIDVRKGPVYIGRNVVIHGPTRIEGPCFIGAGSAIDGARIRPGTTIGPVCRVGGEVEESIFHGHVNKHHDGFIGHCYVGEWVNFGAMSTNSDLKNTYGNVKSYAIQRRKTFLLTDTGTMKFGALIGDHTKFGIGSLINTGAVVGAFCNLFGRGMISDVVASFSWGSSDKAYEEHKFAKALETAKVVMARRGINMTDAYAAMVKSAFEETAASRAKYKKKK